MQTDYQRVLDRVGLVKAKDDTPMEVSARGKSHEALVGLARETRNAM